MDVCSRENWPVVVAFCNSGCEWTMQYSGGICKKFKEIYTCYGVILITVGVQQRQENSERERL